jgi:DNA-binding XRE family transcriptional regulator
MTEFHKDLARHMKNPDFKRAFDEEKELIAMSVSIAEAREHKHLTQAELAKRSGVSQQQISKLENGAHCNLRTLVKVTAALGLKLAISV